MNWEAIGAVGEVLGSLAVFVTLGYLAIQVRHARAETRRALSQNRMTANRELIALELDERNLAAAIKADIALESNLPRIQSILMERAGLTREDAQRVLMVEIARWNYRIHVIAHVEELNEIERDVFDQAIRVRSDFSTWRLIYKEHFKPAMHPDVLKYVENLLSQPAPTHRGTQ